jgi:lantibiotic leader peptide-processing serine protease
VAFDPRPVRSGATMRSVLAVLFACVASTASAATSQYLVVATGMDSGPARAAVLSAGGTVLHDLGAIGVVVATSARGDFATVVARSPGVLSADPDPKIHFLPVGEVATATVPDDGIQGVNTEPGWGNQWDMRQIGADVTAAQGYLGEGAVVAVLDTGVNTQHQDLRGNLDLARSKAYYPSAYAGLTGYAFEDDVFHGSHVACTIAAEINGAGIQGVAPRAKIISVKVLDSDGSGSFGILIAALEYVTGLGGVDAVNMSLGAVFDRVNKGGNGGGGPGNSTGRFLAALGRAIDHATQEGILVISSAGNDGVDLNGRYWSIPAQSGNGMAVSATGPVGGASFDRLASYSNYGSSVVDVAAPGGDSVNYPAAGWHTDMVYSCYRRNPPNANPNWYTWAAGTSMAAPHVTGLAALVVGKRGHVGPARIRAVIENSAANVLPTNFQGKGRIDAAAALAR